MPPVPGLELEGITTLKSMQDADFLRKVRMKERSKKAVVIGGGLIRYRNLRSPATGRYRNHSD